MSANEQLTREAWERRFGEWVVAEIMKAKARWLHLCYAVVLPKALYEGAASQERLREASAWAREQGYRLREMRAEDGGLLPDGAAGETQLVKGELVVGTFRPRVVGEREARHLEFVAAVNGVRVEVSDPELVRAPEARN